MESYIHKLVAPNGYVIESTTNANTTKGYGIFFRSETVISAWTDEDGINLITKLGLTGVTLVVTDPPLMVPGNKKSGSITLASGSIGILL
jgi:hypothetical protein